MSIFLFEKEVDQSLLKSGLTVPISAHEAIQKAVGVSLSKGQRAEVHIRIDDQIYDAKLTNVNFNDNNSNRVVFQIRYAEGSAICKRLKELFPNVDFSASGARKSYIEVYSDKDNILEFKVKSTMKEEFIKYLGPVDSLAGYQRSYKLVFLKSFFARFKTNQETNCDAITSDFREYYLQRKRVGLIPDINADPVINNIENSTISQIYNLILRNPFNAISSHGFMVIENKGEVRFALTPELSSQLSSEDIEKTINIIDQKLDYYFSNIDKVGINGGIMREIVEKMLTEYVPAKEKAFSSHPLGTYFRKTIPQKIYETGLVDPKDYLVTGSVGQGNWATIPWICIFDRSITTTAQKGVYIVYLLSKNGESLYLTFNQGCTELSKNYSRQETIKFLREKADEIIATVDSQGFYTDEEIDLGTGGLGELYQKGTIFYKEYKKNAIPEEEELREDLAKMMGIYREYAKKSENKEHRTWLLSWNPNKWIWDDYLKGVYATRVGAYYGNTWSCTNTHVVPGDRVFLTVLGQGDKNGIIASGTATTGIYEYDH